MSDSSKHNILKDMVNGISDLRPVKTHAVQFRAQMGINGHKWAHILPMNNVVL